MPSIAPHSFPAFVIHAGFIGTEPAFALGDGTVRLGAEARSVAAHAGAVLAAVPSLDGKLLLTGGDDGRVVGTAASGEMQEFAAKGRKWIDTLAAGPSGTVAYGSGRTAWVRDAKGRETEFAQERAVGGLAFAPKGLRLAVATYGGVKLHYVGTNAPPQTLDWAGSHLQVTFSPDGRNVVTTMQEPALHGWRLADGQDMRMSGYPLKVKSLSWSARGRFLASSGADAAILWPFHYKDGPMGKPPLQLGAYSQPVTRVACHPEEEIVAVGYADGLILLVRFEDAQEVMLRRPGEGPISALGWDVAGFRLAFGAETGEAGVIDIAG